MGKRKDPFTQPLSVYDTFVNNLYTQANTNRTAWGIDATVTAAILTLLTAWNSRYAVSKIRNTSTTADRTATNTARKALTTYLRPFVQTSILRNSLLTDEDIKSCGLDPHDRVRTPIGKPATEPDMNYKVSGTHQISAYFRQQAGEGGVSRRAKPDGVGSDKVVYFIGDNPPANPDDFPKTLIATRSPGKILFNPADAGKKVTFASCWVSKSNIAGDYCDMQTMVIP